MSEHMWSLRGELRARSRCGIDALRAERERLVARLAAAEDVVKMARQLVAYDWGARLDDSGTSDDAKRDARELGYAVYEYDRVCGRTDD